MKNFDLGNNETKSIGVNDNRDGTFTALTFTKSKTFKSEVFAIRWLNRQGFHENGEKIR